MPARRPAYGAYALSVLIAAYVLAFVDRQLLSLLTEPIKRDLHLSDVQLGLLQGFGFSMVLAVAGLPVGRMIDTRRRITVLWIGVVLWSLMTAGCGAAGGFLVLLLCRVGLGLGESAMTPSAYSLIGDYLPGRRLGLAVSLYGTGAYVGSGLALLLGAVVLNRLPPQGLHVGAILIQPWRAPFFAAGAAGLLVALWAASLREPARAGAVRGVPPLGEVAAYFRTHGLALAGVHLSIAFAAMAFSALTAWTPAWFSRSFHLHPGQVGRSLGLEVMVLGVAGALAGGFVGDWLRRRRRRSGRLMMVAVAALLAVPAAWLAPLAQAPGEALLRLAPLIALLTAIIAAGPALLQEVTPNRIRGMQHAIAVLTVNLVGLGLGPVLVAWFTDDVLRDEARLALSLSCLCPIMLIVSAGLALAAAPRYSRSLAKLDPAAPEPAPAPAVVARGGVTPA